MGFGVDRRKVESWSFQELDGTPKWILALSTTVDDPNPA